MFTSVTWGAGGVKKIFQGHRLACAKAQRCERTWCVVGPEGRSLQCKEGRGERMIGGEWDQLGDC